MSMLDIFSTQEQSSLSLLISFLPPCELINLQLVNSLCAKIFSEPKEGIWRELVQLIFPETSHQVHQHAVLRGQPKLPTEQPGWKRHFIRQCQIKSRFSRGLYHHACLEGHIAPVNSLCFIWMETNPAVPLIPCLISGDTSGCLVQWDLRSSLQMKALIDFHEGDEGRIVKIMEMGRKEDEEVCCVSGVSGSSLDGSRSSIKVFNAKNGRLLKSINSGLNECKSMDECVNAHLSEFNCIGKEWILSASSNCINVWKLNPTSDKYELHCQLSDGHTYDVKCIRYLTDGSKTWIVSSGLDCHISVWDLESGQLLHQLKGHEGPIMWLETFHTKCHGRVIVSASTDGQIRMWREGVAEIALSTNSQITCARIVRSSLGGNELIVAVALQDRTVTLFKFDLSIQPNAIQLHKINTQTICNQLVVTRDRVCCSGKDSTIRMYWYNSKSYKLVAELNSPGSQCSSMILSHDNSFLLAGYSDSAIYCLNFSPRYEWDYPLEGKDDMAAVLYDSNQHAYLKPPCDDFSIKHVAADDLKPVIVKEILQDVGLETSYLLYNTMSRKECEHLIKKTEALSYEDCYGYHQSYRSNKRVIVEDTETSQVLFERTKHLVPQTYTDSEGNIWDLFSLNSRWRFCRYTPGQHFLAPHEDGFYAFDKDTRSWFTYMLYMNEGYSEGRTTFIKDRFTREEVAHVEPKDGLCIVFPHHLLHFGSVLKDGVKYLMRSELMYKRRKE